VEEEMFLISMYSSRLALPGWYIISLMMTGPTFG
jgi:hypothetical protein